MRLFNSEVERALLLTNGLSLKWVHPNESFLFHIDCGTAEEYSSFIYYTLHSRLVPILLQMKWVREWVKKNVEDGSS